MSGMTREIVEWVVGGQLFGGQVAKRWSSRLLALGPRPSRSSVGTQSAGPLGGDGSGQFPPR